MAATSSRSIPSPFGGNGHNVTFDGRLYIATTAAGWEAFVFRPQGVTYANDGLPVVDDVFSPHVLLNAAPNGENALAICEPNPQPFRCDLAGAPDAAGNHDCYDLVLFDSDASQPDATLRRRTLKVWVRDAKTANAAIEKWEESATTPIAPTLKGIEPTITRDGKLMVWQGHPDNDGDIDILMYSKNASACALSGWSAGKTISKMYGDPLVAGYKLAEKPLRAGDGAVFAGTNLFHGAYPWIFPDGEAILFAATTMPCLNGVENDPPGCGPRRNSISVIGYPTNWGVANVDGGVNPSRVDGVRLFFSSPGPQTFSELPTSPGNDVWPFFGSNTSNYVELGFDDGLDGRYLGLWHMNELVKRDGTLEIARTGDVSGYFNTATVLGGAYIPESNDGVIGRSVHLDGVSGRLAIPHSATLSPLHGLTVEMWLRPASAPDCDANGNWRLLLGKPHLDGTYSLVVEDDGSLQARVRAGGETKSIWSNAQLPIGAWSHVAFTYLAETGELAFFVNGTETNRVTTAPATLEPNDSGITVGASGPQSACPDGMGAFHGAVDELAISSIIRYPEELVPGGNPTPTPTPAGTETPSATPTPGGNAGNGGGSGAWGCSTAAGGTSSSPVSSALVVAVGFGVVAWAAGGRRRLTR